MRLSFLLFKETAEADALLHKMAQELPGDWELRINADCPITLPPRVIRSSNSELQQNTSLLLPLGGDGTVLSAARLAVDHNIPILGVHLGRTGFLTDCPPEQLPSVLQRFAENSRQFQHRTTLFVQLVRRGVVVEQETILNEVQINPPASSHRFGQLVDLQVMLDNRYLTDYHADFLLIATPTGSTGYNLSAGGPIVHPEAHTIILHAVNSPALSVRPLLLDDSAHLTINSNDAKEYTVLLDGRITWQAKHDDTLLIEQSPKQIRFVKVDDYTFVDALRGKLGWCGHPHFKRGAKC